MKDEVSSPYRRRKYTSLCISNSETDTRQPPTPNFDKMYRTIYSICLCNKKGNFRNNKACSCNHCCSGKEKSITYSASETRKAIFVTIRRVLVATVAVEKKNLLHIMSVWL